jgi:hypothetical protein
MRRRLSHGYSQLTYPGWPPADRPWVEGLPDQLGPRKFRLLLSAWCRDLTVPWLDTAFQRDKDLREYLRGVYLAALDVSDKFADTGKSKTALAAARKTTFFRAIEETARVSAMYDTLLSEDSLVGTLDRCAIAATFGDKLPAADLVAVLRHYVDDLTGPADGGQVDARWRTEDVVGLARGIYEERAFDRLPLLADALMDAGCNDDAILSHNRSAGPHVRGCWVVDRVQKKE